MIEIINLCKSFDGKEILSNLNLTVSKGETKVIIGRSGCGKTILLKHIIGIVKPDLGQIIIDGQDITKLTSRELDECRMKFGMLFQGGALFDSLSVGENVGFGLREHTDLDDSTIARRVRESLDMVGLKGIENVMPSKLSGGMKKRVGLARAICTKPRILLYDEPTTGVDPIMGDAINNLIIELRDRLKITSLVVTHDIVSAYKIADSIAMLYAGKIIEAGTPQQIKNTQNLIVRQFISGAAEGPITQSESTEFNHINTKK